MYGKTPKEKLTFQKVLEKISDYDIFKYYCTNFKHVNQLFCSDLRNDKNPTCSITVKNNILIYKDFATGETFNCFSYLSKKFKISFKESLSVVNTDFSLDFSDFNVKKISHKITKEPKIYNIDIEEKSTAILHVNVKKSFSKKELNYWRQYNINEEILKFYNVKSLNAFCINNYWYYVKNISFSYYLGKYKGIIRYKILSPFEKFKWFSNTNKNVVQGLKQLKILKDKGIEIKTLIITSSYKDVMSLYSVGYFAIAPASENTILSTKAVNYIKNNICDNIVMFFDNDEAGKTSSKKYIEKYNLIKKEMFINNEYNSKDPSDFIKDYGKERLIEFLKKEL